MPRSTFFSTWQKIEITFLSIGLFVAAYGIPIIISIMIDFPDDVNLWAAMLALLLMGLISASCMTMIIKILCKSKQENDNAKKGMRK